MEIWWWKGKLESGKLYPKRKDTGSERDGIIIVMAPPCSFYKRAEDFDTLRDYNDYLEEFEDIVFNLANDVDVQSTHARLEAFKSENRDTLERNLARLANEQRQAQIAEDAGREKREKAKVAAESEKEKEIVEMMQVKQKFINELVINICIVECTCTNIASYHIYFIVLFITYPILSYPSRLVQVLLLQ